MTDLGPAGRPLQGPPPTAGEPVPGLPPTVPSPPPAVAEPVPDGDHLHPGVAAALARLEELEGAPVAEHVEMLESVHRLLQDALATLDEV